jgi:hypothetical protein
VTTRDPRQAFVPGQWLGPVAMGTGRTGTAKAVAANVINTRVGEKAAKVYPWMTVIPVVLNTAAANIGNVIRVTRNDPGSLGEAAFYNNMNRIVHIDEMRFMALPPSSPNGVFQSIVDFDLALKIGTSIKHTNYDIVRDFLPLYALATHNNFASPMFNCSLAFDLPSKYLTPKGSAFTIIARNANVAPPSGSTLGVSLNGSDSKGNPYILAREGAPAVTHANFTFSENTGAGAAKDCLIERINFNISRNFTFPYDAILWGLQTEIQFVPPEGPKWHADNDWFPINGIVNQPISHVLDSQGIAAIIESQDIVSYRPVTPHVVTPRQQITVDLKVYQPAFYSMPDPNNPQNPPIQVDQMPIWVIMLGTQESLAI